MAPTVNDYMTATVSTVEETTPLATVMDSMRRGRVRHLCVVRGSRLLGIISDRDVKRALPSVRSGATEMDYSKVLEQTQAAHVMSRSPVCVESGTPLAEAVRVMTSHHVSAVPVLRGGVLAGILSDSDCMTALLELLQPRDRVPREPLGEARGQPTLSTSAIAVSPAAQPLKSP
jgi:acetoin utilization protein AcuB